jgi:hypothetical protein
MLPAFTLMALELGGKRLELLRTFPQITTIATLMNPSAKVLLKMSVRGPSPWITFPFA